VFDVVGRDPQKLAELWRQVEKGEGFDLSHSEFFGRMQAEYGFGSGRSSHADRIAHIRKIHQDYGVVIDPHTADGMKVALGNRDVAVPTLVLETALPAKFEETMVEALGQKPARPAGLENLEQLPQRVEVMPADLAQIQAFIARHVE
jgi:threonine synthase